MAGVKNRIRSYFSFSKKELNGIFLLFILMLIILLMPYVYRTFNKEEIYDLKSFKQEIEAFKASVVQNPHKYKELRNHIEELDLKADYFEFNPNGLESKDWQRLGLSAKQIKVIRNYEAKGGKFYKKEDLKKIYSITPTQYAMLEPYISLPISDYEKKSYKRDSHVNKANNYAVPAIELNSADSALLESISGIGPVFASRIIRYRNRLGGFYSKEQLREVYGMDSLIYSKLKDRIDVNAALIQKMNLNTATFEHLKLHPYLSYKQMNSIIQYRRQHGIFGSADDLKKIAILNEEIIRKIEPYLAF